MPARTVKRIRTCVGCGEQSGKTELKRIVRQADGAIAFDPTGRVPGRGAYVCSVECLEKALRAKRLQRALKANVGEDEADRIVRSISGAFDA